jgi:GNAT superfamily N-acetyltransferase
MQWRGYDPTQDKQAVHRIWREVGWHTSPEDLDRYLRCGRAVVAEVGEEAECAVSTVPGSIRYLEEEVPFVEVTGVATSRVARQQGLAKRLLAHALAADVDEGAALARVCAFDQGFYDQVGFGPGGYEHMVFFDPGTLAVSGRARPPRRLSKEDGAAIHASRLARRRGHGGVNYDSPVITEPELRYPEGAFGLGYYDGGDDTPTHHLWCRPDNVEHGPYFVPWMAYRTGEQFLELMALLKSLGDQVRLVGMREPPDIQLQDLLDRPLRHQALTERSRYQNRASALAFWQVRICDLGECLARTRLRHGEARFNLKLTDPVGDLLEGSTGWRGVAGDYVVSLGSSSGAGEGSDPSLPTLSASVNAFSRLWLGVRPATGLAITDDLSGPPNLLEALDWVLRLPDPKPDWDF